jgi:hypothetical protein
VAKWYTRELQVLVGATPWRFDSSQPHQQGNAAVVVYVSRKADIARLDELVGPKR